MKYTVFIIFFCMYSMAQDVKHKVEDSIAQWRWYKHTAQTINKKELIKKSEIEHLFRSTYFFHCKYIPKSNYEFLIMKEEILENKDPSYWFSVSSCKHVKYFHSFRMNTCYAFTTISNECTECVHDLWDICSHYSDAQNIILDRFLGYAEKKQISYVGKNTYAVSDDCSRVAYMSHEGIMYIYSPGNELALYIPYKNLQDVTFYFT